MILTAIQLATIVAISIATTAMMMIMAMAKLIFRMKGAPLL